MTGCAFATEVKTAVSVVVLLAGATPPTQLVPLKKAVLPALSAQVNSAAWVWLAVSRQSVSR